MNGDLSPLEWARLVKSSYEAQMADGIVPPVLVETLLWATPGGDCIEKLGELGLKTVPLPRGGVVILQETAPSESECH